MGTGGRRAVHPRHDGMKKAHGTGTPNGPSKTLIYSIRGNDMKINRLEIENVKRVRAVRFEPAKDGLTVVGGNNGQGKTTVLDAICWALLGDRYRPTAAQREGSVLPPHIRVTLSNGLVAERKGKNSALTVTDPTGRKGGQQLLNEFVAELALDLPKFLRANNREKAETLLRVIGVDEQLHMLERQEKDLYNRRHAAGQIADQKAKFAKEQVYYPDVPHAPLSAMELILRQQEILAKNGENQRKRQLSAQLEREKQKLRRELDELQERYDTICRDCAIAARSAEDLHDESTAELEQSIANIEEINRKVRANLDREKAEDDSRDAALTVAALTKELEAVRQRKRDLLDGAGLPLPGLSVEEGELLYCGRKWDCMSGAEQLRVAVAIVRKLNPNCDFVLLDGLEQMDLNTLSEFGAWLEAEGLQAIATRVSTGTECSIIIEDGMVQGQGFAEVKPLKSWKAGEF